MIKQNRCPECNAIKETESTCDTCGNGEFVDGKYRGMGLTLDCGYGSILDGNTYNFCSLQCLKKFVDAEIEKGTE